MKSHFKSMQIQIKLVPKCSKNEYGTCEVVSKSKLLIEISQEKNKDLATFLVTVLHELLHAWIFMMKANNIDLNERQEHKWIYSVQGVVIEALDLLKRGKLK